MNSVDVEHIRSSLQCDNSRCACHRRGGNVHCPAHDDPGPSLSVTEKNGRELVHCHAGCDQAAVLEALKARDLWTPAAEKVSQNGYGTRAPTASPSGRNRHIVATYDYADESGALLYQAVRYDPKGFSQRRPDGHGGWLWNLDRSRRVLYRLPEVLAANSEQAVFLCEGEKDVDRLRSLGLVATTCAQGAGKWRDEYNAVLADRTVIILPDNDQAGRAHAEQVAVSLSDIAKVVRLVALPGLPVKGDVSDWLDAGGTVDDLRELWKQTASWKPRDDSAKPETAAGPRLDIRWMSKVTQKQIEWIWPRWLARGKLHILGGLGGIGKGTIMAALAAQFSTGSGVLPDGTPAPLARSLFLLSEDAADDTFLPRLAIHGANTDNVAYLHAVVYPDDKPGMLSLSKHVALLEEAVPEYGIDLLAIDALSDFMPGVDRNSEGEVRDILTPLGQMAQRTGVAIVGVMHPGKGHADLKAFQRLLGASAFGNVARCVWLAGESPDDDGRKLLGVDKTNMSMKPATLAWSRSEDAPICWHGQSDHTIGDVFGSSTATPRDDAEGFLNELLKGGSVQSDRVQALAKAAGLSWATVRRAADTLHVDKYRPVGQKNPPWFWKLPNGPSNDPPPDDSTAEQDREQVEDMDDLLTPIDTAVSNSSSRQPQTRVAHADDDWATREKPQNDGKMLTDTNGEQVVTNTADELLTPGRLDDLLTRESQGVSNSSADDPAVAESVAELLAQRRDELAQWRAVVAAAPDDDPNKAHDLAVLAAVDQRREP